MNKIILFFLFLLISNHSFSANLVCGQDLNGDGDINTEQEYQRCQSTTVNDSYPATISCISGYILNGKICEKTSTANLVPYCSNGFFTDKFGGSCHIYVESASIRSCAYTNVMPGVSWTSPATTDPEGNPGGYGFWYRQVVNGDTCNLWIYGLGTPSLIQSVPVTTTCPSGTSLSGGKCIKDGGYIPPTYKCPEGFNMQDGLCYKHDQIKPSLSCAQGGELRSELCEIKRDEYYCPIMADMNCISSGGGQKCSPNKCIDIDLEKPIEDGNIDGSMLVNDGKKNEDGLCLDQMFIFNGRAQDCKMPGVSNAFKDCCKSEGKALSDDAGSLMSAAQTMSTVSHVYSAATEAYTAYNAAIQAGQTAAAAMNSGIAAAQNYMMVAFDPTSLAISVAVYVVMKYLATACDQLSMETALMNDSGYCHRVGTYCKKRIKFIGCVQKAQSHCCFNSKLARIIHEQGRPQLKTGINNWGSPEAPLCRGFTPEEFQSVDFGKIDLSEYIDEIQKNATEQIQKNMSNITSDFIEQTH